MMSEKSVRRGLWGAVGVLVLVFSVVVMSRSAEGLKVQLLWDMGKDLEKTVYGKYEDKEYEYWNPVYFLFDEGDRVNIVEILKSTVDNEYHEMADTVYDTSVEFKGAKVILKAQAKYKDIDIQKELGIEEFASLSEDEYWSKVHEHILKNYKYRINDKVDLSEFLKDRKGQCYSLSELGYLIGKQRGNVIRMKVSTVHAWNVIIYGDRERYVDFTVGMESDTDD